MKLKIYSWMIISCALLSMDQSWAFDQVRLLKTSPGGDLIVLNVGKDYFNDKKLSLAALVDEELIKGSKLENKKIFVLKAILKAVKVKNHHSAWRVVRLPGSFSSEANKKYHLLSLENSLFGRKDFTFNNRTIVGSDLKKMVKNYLNMNDEYSLSHLEDDYILSDHVKTTRSDYDTDFELPDLATWEGEEILKSQEIYNSPHRDEFEKAKKLETFEKMVSLFLDIYNDPEFNYGQYYMAQKRGILDVEFKDNSDQVTEEESYWLKKKQAATNRAKYMKEIQSKGESWSEDFNDVELEEAVINIGLESEKLRQTDYSKRRFDYQLNINVGFNLKDNASNTQNSSNNKFHFGLGGEMFPFKKFPSLGKFTFAGEMRFASDSIAEAGGANAKISEFSFAGFTNYYFLDSVQSIRTVVPFVGLGIRLGRGSLTASTGETGSYNLASFPILNFGAVYNTPDSQGYRVNLSIETINLNLIQGDVNLVDKLIYEDARLGFAWTKLL